jgi:preprotein translocase subunit Sec61beta
MKKQAKGKFENLEKLAITPASIIYAGVNYHP